MEAKAVAVGRDTIIQKVKIAHGLFIFCNAWIKSKWIVNLLHNDSNDWILGTITKSQQKRVGRTNHRINLGQEQFFNILCCKLFLKLSPDIWRTTGYSFPKKALSSAFLERKSRATYFNEYFPSVCAKPDFQQVAINILLQLCGFWCCQSAPQIRKERRFKKEMLALAIFLNLMSLDFASQTREFIIKVCLKE